MSNPPPPSPLSTPLPWEMVADAYESDILPLFVGFAEEALRLAASPPKARILDVAAGPGTLSLLAAATAAKVAAIDFAPEMITRLTRRAAAAGAGNVEARVADGQELPFPDASFDAAFSMFGVIFFPDRGRGLREMRRVLVRGGRAVVSSWLPIENAPLLAAVFGALREQLPDSPPPPAKGPLADPEDFKTEMADAGFHDVDVRRVARAAEFPDMETAWASIRRSTAPLLLVRRNLGEERWTAIDAAIHRRLLERFGAGPQRLEMPAWLGAGTA